MGMISDFYNVREKYHERLKSDHRVIEDKFDQIIEIYKNVFEISGKSALMRGLSPTYLSEFDHCNKVEVNFDIFAKDKNDEHVIILDAILFDMANEDIHEYFLNKKLLAEANRDIYIAEKVADYQERLNNLSTVELLYAKEVL